MLKYHIQTIEVGSGGASAVTFSSIPASYTDLTVVCSTRATVDQRSLRLRLNGSTSNFSARYLQGNGSVINNFTDTSVQGLTSSSTETANNFSNSSFYIANYLSNTPKAISVDAVIENNGTQAFQRIGAGLWSSTEAIAIVQISSDSGDFAQYSSFSLYGIRRGSDGRTEVASGGTITTSGGYTIHTFNSSGTFVANRDMDVEYLVIGGGGGGGTLSGGGGGAGGYRTSVPGATSGGGASAEPTLRVNAGTSYSILVGAGGNGASADGLRGDSGNSSVFAGISSIGGGGGGHSNAVQPPTIGGSGGGGGYDQTGTAVGAAGIAGQGYAGGTTTGAVRFPEYPASGGGGAGAVGGSSNGSAGGVGGAGVASSITGTSVTRAGGGGGAFGTTGAAGGSGGGGAGGGVLSGTNRASGSVNTGSGGGGGRPVSTGNGGSGVVIIRYLTPAS